jgi:hypothetical protein
MQSSFGMVGAHPPFFLPHCANGFRADVSANYSMRNCPAWRRRARVPRRRRLSAGRDARDNVNKARATEGNMEAQWTAWIGRGERSADRVTIARVAMLAATTATLA